MSTKTLSEAAEHLALSNPLTEKEAETEFFELFGRDPDDYDRKLGLQRCIEFQRLLMQVH